MTEQFGPNGGTIKFNIGLSRIRIDVEQLKPHLRLEKIAGFYPAYLKVSTIPLIESNVSGAKLLHEEAIALNDLLMYFSVVLMPNTSDYEDGRGNRHDAVRSQVQYTNGRFVYTISRKFNFDVGDDPSLKFEFYKKSMIPLFEQCSFPIHDS